MDSASRLVIHKIGRGRDLRKIQELIYSAIEEGSFSCSNMDALREYWRSEYSLDQLEKFSEENNRFEGKLGLVAEINDEPVGIAVGYYFGGVASLTWLYVSSPYRGRGIGSELVKSYAKLAKESGMHKLELYTNPYDEKLIKFYQRLGFRLLYKEENMWFGCSVAYMLLDL